jgi:LPS-assembly lipoprotein
LKTYLNKTSSLSIILLISLLLNGCGFKLRGDQPLPVGIEQLRFVDMSNHAPLQRELLKRLKVYNITVVDSMDLRNPLQTLDVRVLPDSLDRRLLSTFSTGQVAEYELTLSVRYRIAFANEDPQTIQFTVSREYQDDPDAILAKSRELELVLREMRQQASDRMIRLLANQMPLSQ